MQNLLSGSTVSAVACGAMASDGSTASFPAHLPLSPVIIALEDLAASTGSSLVTRNKRACLAQTVDAVGKEVGFCFESLCIPLRGDICPGHLF